VEEVHSEMKLTENNSNGVVYMASPNISTTHAFTTRFGGVSTGIYESLNFAQRADDDFENVKENYNRLCFALCIATEDIVCSTQVHGNFIRVITKDDRGGLFKPNSNQADGAITDTPGVALLVFTADCVPILLHDPVKNVIGAVHAGWRGTAADAVGTAVRKMESEFGCSPAEIKAAIGPCISKCCYETDADVADALRITLSAEAESCLTRQGEKYYTDLKEANRLLLSNSGVNDIVISNECTSCRCDKYWSHRKTNGQRGSQVSVIVLNRT